MLIDTPVPPQLAQILARLEAVQQSGCLDEESTDRLLCKVTDAEEHLQLVARPVRRRDKGSERELPQYAARPLNAPRANQALSSLPRLRAAFRAAMPERMN